jgi:hypothetical protein
MKNLKIFIKNRKFSENQKIDFLMFWKIFFPENFANFRRVMMFHLELDCQRSALRNTFERQTHQTYTNRSNSLLTVARHQRWQNLPSLWMG